MSTLQGRYLRDTYKDLLQVSNNNVGVDDTARYIEDGEGTPSVLSISTSNVGIGTADPVYKFHVADADEPNLLIQRTTPNGNVPGLTLNSVGGTGINNRTGDVSLLIVDTVGDSEPVMRFSTTNGASPTKHTMFITNGNVGIGTTSPDVKLEVQGASSPVGTDLEIISVQTQTSDHRLSLGVSSDSDAEYAWIRSVKAGAELPLILNNGSNVGIGTTDPRHPVELYGKGKKLALTSDHPDGTRINHVELSSDGSGYGYMMVYNNVGNSQARVHSAGTSYFNGGNVGIGTTTPQHKLTISGGHLQLHSSTHLTALDGDAYRQAIGWNAAADSNVMNAFINCEDVGNWGGKLQFWTRGEFGGEAAAALTIGADKMTTAHVIKTKYGIITDQTYAGFGSGNSAVASINQHGEGTVFHVVATRHTGTANTPQLETGYVAFSASGAGVYQPVIDHASISITFSAVNSTITATNLGGDATIRIAVLQVA